MNANTTAHLTDEQFAECLTAEYPQPAVQAHLAACDPCREELGVFMASMDDFSHAALGWSRAKQEVPHAKLQNARHTLFAPLQWALACVLALAVGVPVMFHVEHTSQAGKPGMIANVSDSAAQIAQDNRLMQSVDLALDQSDPSPYQEYHLDQPDSRTRSRSRAE